MIHKIIPSVDYSWWLKRLDIQLNAPTKQSYIQVPKVVKPRTKKCSLKTLGTSAIEQPRPKCLLNLFYFSLVIA